MTADIPGRNEHTAFEPHHTAILARAVELACTQLGIPASFERERQVIAGRIADLARAGVLDARMLSDRVVREAQGET